MDYEVREPDLQVKVVAGSYEICFVGFWQRADIHAGFEVVAGVYSQNEISNVITALRAAIEALGAHDWVTVDELHTFLDEPPQDSPF